MPTRALLVLDEAPFPENKNGKNKIYSNIIRYSKNVKFTLLIPENEFSKDQLSCLSQYNSVENVLTWKVSSKNQLSNAISFLRKPKGTLPKQQLKNLFTQIFNIEDEFDSICIGSPSLAEIIHLLPETISSKTILNFIDSLSLYWGRRASLQRWGMYKIAYYYEFIKAKRFEGKTISKYSVVNFVSDVDKKAYERISLANNSSVISNGVDIEYFHGDSLITTEPTLVFTGNMDYAPNHDAAIFLIDKIMPKVWKNTPKTKLFIVGRGTKFDLQSRANEQVTITGFVPDIRPFLNGNIYVSPLRVGSGIKNKILEAMSMEMPIVASSLSMDGIQAKGGVDYLATSIDPDEFAKQINLLLNDKNICSSLGKHARTLVESNYSWNHSVCQYENLFSRMSP